MGEMFTYFTWLHVVWMGIGAGFGAAMRYCISLSMERYTRTFPWATLLVNLSGAALLGGAAAYFNDHAYTAPFFFWELGVFSGYTTMSAFALESFSLAKDKRYLTALAYCVLSLCGAVIALMLGFHLGGLLL